jgi:hypothetical protein
MFCKKCGTRIEANGRCPLCVGATSASSGAKVSGLAKASMIIGIVSLLFGVIYILPITGIILGLCAIPGINKGLSQGKGMLVAGLILNIIGLAVGILVTYEVTVAVNNFSKHFGGEFSMQKAGRKLICVSQLVQINGLCILYAADNQNYLPPNDGVKGLKPLLKQFNFGHKKINTSQRFFICPAFKGKDMTTLLEGVSEDQVTYVYFGGFKVEQGQKLKLFNTYIPIIFDYPGNHKGNVNVIYLDGSPDSILTGAENCVKFIAELHKKHKYPPETLKLLLAKAAKADLEHQSSKIQLKAIKEVKQPK